ncbi:hypothetical protein [Nocardia wallacei]|uniref:hypothetical protein n=1 Tax=Nocardia wallacei TaxID=480035 RepID=UPI0024559FD2|nr:hypothetical protein [Nocardia wallacei]
MSTRPGNGPTQRKIFESLSDGKKRTCREIADKSGVPETVVNPTVRRSAGYGFVRDTGERGGKSGRAILWQLTAEGRSILESESESVAAQ